MSAITAVTFDQSSYVPGATITATVAGTWEEADEVTITAPDGGTGSGPITVIEPVGGADTGGLAWKLVSDNGTRAVLTAQAAAAGTFTFTATARIGITVSTAASVVIAGIQAGTGAPADAPPHELNIASIQNANSPR